MKFVAMALDPDGIPRAWGRADDENTARQMCDHQLMLYRDKKRAVGDPLAFAKFTIKISTE